jgi:GNAT superfamily N-acetyltransferase
MSITLNASTQSEAAQQRAAHTLGMAFAHDSAMTFFLPCEDDRADKLTKMFGASLRACDLAGGVEIVDEGLGALGWVSSEHFPLSFVTMARSGMLWTPLYLGLPSMMRLQRHETACEHRITEQYRDINFAYLWMIGVLPTASGQGYGRQLIESACTAMRMAGHTVCVLKTENRVNVPLYEHLGFGVTHHKTVRASNLPVWILERPL